MSEAGAARESSGIAPRAAQGAHVLADLGGIDAALLRDAMKLETLLVTAARDAGAHVLAAHFHHFGGEQGVTGVVLLAESHITIHTWPEHRFAALDVFMCGNARPERAVAQIAEALQAETRDVRTCERGARAPR